MGVDKMGKDEMGSRRSGTIPIRPLNRSFLVRYTDPKFLIELF